MYNVYTQTNVDNKFFYILILLSDGKGQILFGEFVTWALEKNLDIEDDID